MRWLRIHELSTLLDICHFGRRQPRGYFFLKTIEIFKYLIVAIYRMLGIGYLTDEIKQDWKKKDIRLDYILLAILFGSMFLILLVILGVKFIF